MSSLPRKSSIDSCRLSCESCELLANDIEANLSNHPKRSPENGDDERKERSFLLHGFLWSKYQWVLLGLWILSILLSVQITRWGMSTANNYEIGFSTDLRQYSSQTATLKTPAHNGSEPAIEAIELETVRFTGDLLIDPNGTIYRNIEGKQYVGEPSPDIDSAWRDIIRGTGVDLTTSDAERAGVIGKTYQRSSGHYLAGMHIFHELHCLNKLRKASHPDYYNNYDGESYDYWR
ncbi:hypothetical protein N7540_005769 [Penicillium herquei]|nr:hypothetical protein N7540_005769 [Penicillium herquei]